LTILFGVVFGNWAIIRNVEHLKEVIICCWAEITQALVDSTIDQWSSRASAVIKECGGYIENLFD
jgi:hypothetical protein